MKRPLHIALIGYQFMGKAHSHAMKNLHMFADMLGVEPKMKVICGRKETELIKVAKQFGWERWDTSWENVVADPEIDVVDIVTPGNSHRDIAVAAADNGKHVICEKPLALCLDDARAMVEAVDRNAVKHLVNFNYRRVPAVMHARNLIETGQLGEIYHFRGIYQQDWPLDPEFPFIWRFDKKIAGAGSMADKGSHIIDLARYLVGDFQHVASRTNIFVDSRVDADGKRQPVTTDDAAVFVSEFESGALGLFQTSRMSAGHKNDLQFEINGSLGSVRFCLERLNELEVYFAEDDPQNQGFRTVSVTQDVHPYLKYWWPPGHVLGWEHTFVHQIVEMLTAIDEDRMPVPNFHDGLKCQEVIEAIETANNNKNWQAIT